MAFVGYLFTSSFTGAFKVTANTFYQPYSAVHGTEISVNILRKETTF